MEVQVNIYSISYYGLVVIILLSAAPLLFIDYNMVWLCIDFMQNVKYTIQNKPLLISSAYTEVRSGLKIVSQVHFSSFGALRKSHALRSNHRNIAIFRNIKKYKSLIY